MSQLKTCSPRGRSTNINHLTFLLFLQEEEEEEENRMSDEAERRFREQQRGERDDPTAPRLATVEQPETSAASFVNISFELEPEPPLRNPDTNRVPSPLPS